MGEKTLDSILPDKRFIITKESMRAFKGFRSVLEDMQVDKPWLKGLAFFGSRTISAEISRSDVDLFVFYDGEEYMEKGSSPALIWVDGRMKSVKERPKSTTFPKESILSHLETLIDRKIGRWYSIMQQKSGGDAEFVGVDISKRQTDLVFEDFVRKVNSDDVAPVNIVTRFLLSVGKPVYENRKYILDKIAQLDEPDKYISALMNGLQDFERSKKKEHAISYAHFPRTLSEARDYFLTEPEAQ